MSKYWKLGIPRDMIALENRIDTLDMIYHITCDIYDDDAIKAAIRGLHSYYQKKHQLLPHLKTLILSNALPTLSARC